MERLVAVDDADDIVPEYRGTPVGRLLACHNLGASPDDRERAALLVGTCMDHRVRLRMPENFAYVLRSGGARLEGREFEISFAVAVGGVSAVAVIGHSDCGMCGVTGRREAFVEGLVERAGWDAGRAGDHFGRSAPAAEVDDPIAFTLAETQRLASLYPEVLVAPLFYRVEDGRLYLIREQASGPPSS